MELSSKCTVQQTLIMIIANYVIDDILPSDAIYLCIARNAMEAVTLPNSTVTAKFLVNGPFIRVGDWGGTEHSFNC